MKERESQVNTHEVVAKVSNFNFGSVDDGDASDSTEDEILEGLGASWAAIEQTDARVLQSRLAYFSPDPKKQSQELDLERSETEGKSRAGGLPELTIVLGFRGLRHCWFPFHQGSSVVRVSATQKDSKRREERCREQKG